jgi:hypothetical protein
MQIRRVGVVCEGPRPIGEAAYDVTAEALAEAEGRA